MLAWKTYTTDNDDKLINNFGIDTTDATIAKGKAGNPDGFQIGRAHV